MPRDLELARVRGADGRFQLRPRDVHVRLEGGGAEVCPVFVGAPGVLGAGQLPQHGRERAGAFQIRPGDVDLRPGDLPRIDELLDLHVRLRLDRAGRADRGDAAGQVQPRKAEGHLVVEGEGSSDRLSLGRGSRIEKVVVHPDQSGNHRRAREIDHLRAGRRGSRRRRTDRFDLSPREHDSLILLRRRSRAVHDFHMRERHDRGLHRDELANFPGEGRGTLRRRDAREQGNHQGRARGAIHAGSLTRGRTKPGQSRPAISRMMTMSRMRPRVPLGQ